MILETDLQAKFLIPMALSLAAGVAFATVLTLVLIPSLLAMGPGAWPWSRPATGIGIR
jgi:multidrug efflux pump subunit AcrB